MATACCQGQAPALRFSTEAASRMCAWPPVPVRRWSAPTHSGVTKQQPRRHSYCEYCERDLSELPHLRSHARFCCSTCARAAQSARDGMAPPQAPGPRVCGYSGCDADLDGLRASARYCTAAHRTAAHRERQADEAREVEAERERTRAVRRAAAARRRAERERRAADEVRRRAAELEELECLRAEVEHLRRRGAMRPHGA